MCSYRCTALYSATGVLFLLFVYVLLSTQPFFVGGVTDLDRAKTSALGAMAVFAALFVGAVVGMVWSKRSAERGRGVDGEDDGRGAYGRLNVDLEYQMRSDE